jgi:hypothetical protein
LFFRKSAAISTDDIDLASGLKLGVPANRRGTWRAGTGAQPKQVTVRLGFVLAFSDEDDRSVTTKMQLPGGRAILIQASACLPSRLPTHFCGVR